MIGADVVSFVRANLPPPPARILEIGAGEGELARALGAAGYDVLAIDPDPRGPGVRAVALAELDEPESSFDAAAAIVSLHHVEPLDDSCRRLAGLLKPGAPLLVDEFDVGAFDRREAAWWLEQRRALGGGHGHDHDPDRLVREHREHLHALPRILEALDDGFDVGQPVRGPYLYRWDLDGSLRATEEELIARGELAAVGARLIARRAGRRRRARGAAARPRRPAPGSARRSWSARASPARTPPGR